MHAKERLEHLLELAGKGQAEAPQLARELCELLLDWPLAYPSSMRAPFESLLEKTIRGLDDAQRDRLASFVGGGGDLPLAILNEFFFVAPERLRARILSRNAKVATASVPLPTFDAAAFVDAARSKKGEAYARAFATLFGISKDAADAVLGDKTGEALAIACKGAELPRAVFSAIALLTGPTDPAAQKKRLAAFEQVSADAARNLVRFWRQRFDMPGMPTATIQAA